MKKNLSVKEAIGITSMLFGMFFGAGNLIFPAKLGIDAGRNLWFAYAGLVITAVGLPLLAVAALGISRSEGVLELAGKVGKKYGMFFTTLLYLTIGPLFAIPRCASTSFVVGAVHLLPAECLLAAQVIFSLLFFIMVLVFSLKPGGIMTWIGKILNPVFLVFLGMLVVAVLMNPINSIAEAVPANSFLGSGDAFINGFLEGYNTLDALAGLAFGIVVVDVVRRQGIEEPGRIAANTVRSGIFSCVLMGMIYLFVVIISAQCADICAECTDGSAVLATIANAYFKSVGSVFMLLIVTIACLKTAIGLVTSCSEAFAGLFPGGPSYKIWTVVFCAISFGIANFGLSSIVAFCVPVLRFLYPLAITLILLALFGKFFHDSRRVYIWTTGFTLIAAALDFMNALSGILKERQLVQGSILDVITDAASQYLPLFEYGLGWVSLAGAGCIIGLILNGILKDGA
ncbi:MAG: branched-chain amino acid transport system II carrier protein [Eubacteriales bacterium]|nr:branched-chain amino acid transport system II carrier protein [Eubacteriales bacterium]